MDHPTFRVRCRVCRRLLYSLHKMTQHCSTHCLSSAPPTAGAPPRSVSASQPPQTSSASFPNHTVANYDTVSSSQSGTSTSPATGVILPQAAAMQHHSIVPPDGSAITVTRPTCWASYLLQENRQLRNQNSDYKFLLCWCLHHLQSLQTPPPSASDEVDMTRRSYRTRSTKLRLLRMWCRNCMISTSIQTKFS